MVGKRDPKGKARMRRVSNADGDPGYGPSSRPATPGPSNPSQTASQESPAQSHVSSASQQSQSRPNPNNNQPVPSAPPANSATPAPSQAPHIPANRYSTLPSAMPQVFGAYQPFVGNPQMGIGTPFAPVVNPYFMAAAQPPAPNPGNPPDELGPPPPAPPPPAIPPVVNPYGVHFQPQVPGTETGPIIHRYVPRHDPIGVHGMMFPGQQMAAYMANGAVMPMQPLPFGVAPVTAPINPIVMQQPYHQPMMLPNQSIPGGPALMLPGAMQMPGNPSHFAGLPAQPPVHVEPALGVGLTPNETFAENVRIAQNNKAYEPQDFKPADPDPYRMYWFRELNGHWAVFPRRQIDRLNARWYRTDDGIFYAVRLPDN
ncbi:hypothetical protein N658DRAFT_520013 [Parathielavia hyrcaniae]|uniref:Uncharacterized protein n=1 Tax=Parathielavia hyrcaniae TaxID=113614 RepID=A0AAN6T603_9PEZI|nr:hypothetical protein N658DRAFT_520013 [Parathielavia hyrcaniae]